MSCAAAMLYHQNRFAVVKPGSRRRPSSQIFSPATRRFDCRHSHTSIRSRNSQPLATTPCARGSVPVMKVDWTVQVTAGVTVDSGRIAPARASAAMCGVSGPMWRGDRPTTRMTSVGCMGPSTMTRGGAARPSLIDNEQPQIEYQGQSGPRPRRANPVPEPAMTIAARAPVSAVTLLRLGRVSNLPTAWTNVLAGAVIAGGDWRDWRGGAMLAAMSLFYVGGMYLNDYFDRAIDARERPERPIPSGAISARTVATIGFGLLGAVFLATAAMGPVPPAMAALVAGAIVVYDLRHKGNPFAPVVMGACRAFVYGAVAAALTGSIPVAVAVSGVVIGAYVAGLTYAARQESLDKVGNLWPLALLAAPLAVSIGAVRQGSGAIAISVMAAAWIAAAIYLLARRPVTGSVSRAVGWLIAGISLCDAAILASVGAIAPAVAAAAAFLATLVAQKYIAGT